MATAVPIFSLGTLVAPNATPLHARLAKEGRLIENELEVIAGPWSTNIVPKSMTRKQLFEGVKCCATRCIYPKRLSSVLQN